jgi:hypothetical protein
MRAVVLLRADGELAEDFPFVSERGIFRQGVRHLAQARDKSAH